MNRGRALLALAAACGTVAAVGVTQAVGAGSKPDARLAANANRVNGIAASRKPKPGRLVPLGSKGLFPASTINPAAGKGITYRGVVAVEGTAPVGTDPAATPAVPYYATGSVTIPLTSPGLEPGDAGILGGGIEVPDCEGSFLAPTAPPGKLCIYPGFESGGDINDDEADVLNVLKNGEGALEATPWIIGNGRLGVRVEVQAAAPGRVKFAATWAFTPA